KANKIPGITSGQGGQIAPIINIDRVGNNRSRYAEFLRDVKGLSGEEANKLANKTYPDKYDYESGPILKDKFEQPESPINPATGLTREEEQIIKERDIGTRVPKDLMEFSRNPSNLVAYSKWLQTVKGLSREEAGNRVRELEKALDRTSFGSRPRGQFEDIEELPPLEQPESPLAKSKIEESKLPEYKGKSSFFP